MKILGDYNNEFRSMPYTQWGRVSRYVEQDGYSRMKSRYVENKHMDRFHVHENKSGSNIDETVQEKLKSFRKSFMQELSGFCMIIVVKF